MSGLARKADRLNQLVGAINELAMQDVLIGVPAMKTQRDPEPGEPAGITNAAVGYIQEFGSPASNIPARPFLIPGVKAAQKEVADRLKAAAQGAMTFKPTQVRQNMMAAGLIAQNSVRKTLTDGIGYAPLAEATLAARRRRGRTGTRPLVDTGQLRNAITYVIRHAGKQGQGGGSHSSMGGLADLAASPRKALAPFSAKLSARW
ncbi:MAG: hypothetical protein KGH75_02425 [Rhodospirillales bacterium]|nr:hypothetical protein [Rhodospirillales bacterium]